MKGAIFNRLAERELAEAAQYYEAEVPGLGRRFREEVEAAVALISTFPEIAPRTRRNLRRLLLPKFPYYLLYRPLEGGGVRIIAVGHQKRLPEYWAGRD